LTAQGRGRPFVIAGYAVGTEGPQPLHSDAVAELRTGVDAVLSDDGRVEEGVPESHGRGALNVPPTIEAGDPDGSLRMLYAGGVRIILLAGAPEVIHSYAEARLVDRLVVDRLAVPDASGVAPMPLPPWDYSLSGAHKTPTGTRVWYMLDISCAIHPASGRR
jgi:diaminohydroxyphosphoribosylaminopyrimidine deaminase / 5-amino-6-(5-phosphoribosylamino)uracil reductase